MRPLEVPCFPITKLAKAKVGGKTTVDRERKEGREKANHKDEYRAARKGGESGHVSIFLLPCFVPFERESDIINVMDVGRSHAEIKLKRCMIEYLHWNLEGAPLSKKCYRAIVLRPFDHSDSPASPSPPVGRIILSVCAVEHSGGRAGQRARAGRGRGNEDEWMELPREREEREGERERRVFQRGTPQR